MAGGDKLRIAPGQLRRQLLQSFAEEPRGRGGGKKRGRGRGRGKGMLPNRSQSPPPSATSVSNTSPLQTSVSPVRDPPVQERTPMQDTPVQEPTPSHKEWGSWGDGEGLGRMRRLRLRRRMRGLRRKMSERGGARLPA